MSGEMSDKKPHGLRDQLSVCMSDETFEYTLEKMSDGMPDQMSEYMSVGGDHSKYGFFQLAHFVVLIAQDRLISA